MAVLILALAPMATLGCSPRSTETGAVEYYAGETVRIIVPFGPGGGFDVHARVMAQRLGTYIPGHPTVVVENMPGAGGFVAARYMAQRARPDGLTLGMFNAGLVAQQMAQEMETDSLEVDVSRFVAVGSPAPEVSVCVFRADSPFRHLQTWLGTETPPRMGMAGVTGGADVSTLILSAALGLPVQPVRGYAGMAEIRHAIDMGEVDGACPTYSSFESLFVPPENYAIAIQGGAEVIPGLDEIPLALALTDRPDEQALLGALAQMRGIGRFYALPPGTPDERVRQMRRAFLQTMTDPVFQQNAARARLAIDLMSGEEVSARISTLLALPDEPRNRLAQIVGTVTQ